MEYTDNYTYARRHVRFVCSPHQDIVFPVVPQLNDSPQLARCVRLSDLVKRFTLMENVTNGTNHLFVAFCTLFDLLTPCRASSLDWWGLLLSTCINSQPAMSCPHLSHQIQFTGKTYNNWDKHKYFCRTGSESLVRIIGHACVALSLTRNDYEVSWKFLGWS